MSGAVREEVLRAIVLVAFGRAAIVPDVLVIGIAERDLPKQPTLAGLLVPESQPFRVAVEASAVDRGRITGIPRAVRALHRAIVVGVSVQRISDQHVVLSARRIGTQAERREESIHLIDLGSERITDVVRRNVFATRPG